MREHGVITKAEEAQARQEPLVLSQNHKDSQNGLNEYYVDAVIAELNELSIDLDQEIHVHTNYDPDVQAALDKSIRAQMCIRDRCSNKRSQCFIAYGA